MRYVAGLRPSALSLLLSVLLSLLITACAASTAPTTFKPEASAITQEEWAARYPQQYDAWAQSVHGVAFLEGNADAPGCTDCHQDPETGEVKTSAFHLDIPARCARCHSDATKMGQYDILSNVYETYLADYHGTTIAYYRANDPSAWHFEAVCSDCHGSHAVYAKEDARSQVTEANVAATCQQCHADAPAGFSAASGHYPGIRNLATRADAPLVFWIKLIYQSLIPITLGLMLGYVGLDITYRLRKQRGEKHNS